MNRTVSLLLQCQRRRLDFYMRQRHAGQWMINLLVAVAVGFSSRGQISMATWVIEVTEFDYESRCDL